MPIDFSGQALSASAMIASQHIRDGIDATSLVTSQISTVGAVIAMTA